MTHVRQIHRTQETITVVDDSGETIVLTVVAENGGIYAVQTDDVAYQFCVYGDRSELYPQSLESIFDSPGTRYIVLEYGDGTRWVEVVEYHTPSAFSGIGSAGPSVAGDTHTELTVKEWLDVAPEAAKAWISGITVRIELRAMRKFAFQMIGQYDGSISKQCKELWRLEYQFLTELLDYESKSD